MQSNNFSNRDSLFAETEIQPAETKTSFESEVSEIRRSHPAGLTEGRLVDDALCNRLQTLQFQSEQLDQKRFRAEPCTVEQEKFLLQVKKEIAQERQEVINHRQWIAQDAQERNMAQHTPEGILARQKARESFRAMMQALSFVERGVETINGFVSASLF